MTERLYLSDPYLTSFRARVVELRELEGKPAAVLDRSAFYPEGGGQPGDRGRLGAARVIDTQDLAGVVLHVLDQAVPQGDLDAEVDWERRFDHMQQHHGQHLLSAAFDKAGAPTVSFHLGERTCTIDLDAPLSRLDLRAAEAATNQSIWRDLPVVARDFTGEERARLPLRKEPVKGDRVVLVEGVDASPCGGTHPRRTGEVGCVAILRAQKWGGAGSPRDGRSPQGAASTAAKARIEFACGGRVVKLLRESGETLAQAAEALKSAPADVGTAAARVAAEAQAQRKSAEALARDLAKHEAAQLRAKAGAGPVVARVERGAGFARAVAQAVSADGGVALIGAVEDGRGHLCFARPKGPGPAMGDLLKQALALLGGKGGGGAEFAQGSGDPARLDEALALAAGKLG
jgi:alanyl-tRNA synthetase